MSEKQRAVVTGASSGIGAATVRQLRALDWDVVAVARREDRLRELADATGASYVVADVTSDEDVARACAHVTGAGPLHALVNIAGVAVRADRVDAGDVADWQQMYDVNVLGTLRMTRALLPALRATGRGDVVLMGSTAGLVAYEGGAGYAAAKHGVHAVAGTLRLEEAENDIRVIEIAPGMVRTEEFSINRFEGDRDRADAVYAGVAEPLTADDVAAAVVWTLTLPHHMNVDLMVLRPVAQAAQHKVIRRP
jgi:NADP-dependent 3-hydroxy acid dehydrogenase YdfG